MAQLGRYKVPNELKDEDKWFKYFTKKQLAITIAVIFVDWQIVSIFIKLHMSIVGITFAILLTILAFIVAVFRMPTNKHIYGGGNGLDVLLLRVLKRKLLTRNKVIFTAGFDKEDLEEYESR